MEPASNYYGGYQPLNYTQLPELHHYTGCAGLFGILTSNVLYATRYDQLNDAVEVKHFENFYAEALAEAMKSVIIRERKKSQKTAMAVSKLGGANTLAVKRARELVADIYRYTFNINKRELGFAIPFFTSFCSHRTDDIYEKENGLLSQWRGYQGRGEGEIPERYALVLDTKRLNELLNLEAQRYAYPYIGLVDVVYNKMGLSCADVFPELMRVSEERLKYEALNGRSPLDVINRSFRAIVSSASSFKHCAFAEEREVRIVATVQREEALQASFGVLGHKPPDLNFKSTFSNPDGIERIKLFDGLGKILPITRIIVGPHPDQSALYERTLLLTKGSIPVIKSKTPFIG